MRGRWLRLGIAIVVVAMIVGLAAWVRATIRKASYESARRTAFAELINRRRRGTGTNAGSFTIPLAASAWPDDRLGRFFAQKTNALPPGTYRYIVRLETRPPTFAVFDAADRIVSEGLLAVRLLSAPNPGDANGLPERRKSR